jgi:acetate---CoA ligase (ADP-forming)
MSFENIISPTNIAVLGASARIDSVCLERVSQLVIDFPEIQELHINPLLVFEQGKGYRAVDARIVVT